MLVFTFLLLVAAQTVQGESHVICNCENFAPLEYVSAAHKISEIVKNVTELQKAIYVLQEKIIFTKTEETQKMWTKESLLKYLHQMSGSKTISGIFAIDPAVDRNQQIKKLQVYAGVLPGVVGMQFSMYSANKTEWGSFINDLISHWKHGSLVCIDWYYGSPLVNMNIFTNYTNAVDREEKWAELIQEGSTVNQVWKRQLGLIIPYLKQLEAAGVIAILDIFSLTNLNGYIWRGRPGVNGTAKLYKLTHDYLTKEHNLTSFIWSWSLYYKGISQLEEYWPGSDYVDVVSVHMHEVKQLPTIEYLKVVDVAGNKLMSMEWMHNVPTPELLAVQPRWTWFTATSHYLEHFNDNNKLKMAFNSISVINRGEIDYFKDTN